MSKKPTPSDIYDIDKKTGALILGKNELEKYAKKYLSVHCEEALKTPMPLPVDEIIQKAGLTVKTASLSRNLDVFGCCMLLDGYVEIYDRETGESSEEFYPAGTLLFDPDSEWMYGEGAKRNTLIHEALHWEKDKTFFNILKLRNKSASEKLYPIMCRQSGTFYEPPEGKKTKENQVKWLEWQAHRLAPRVLMPFDMFKKKAREIMAGWKKEDVIPSCDALIEELSSFFIVSRSSAKYRLIEVGLQETISKFNDYDEVYADIDAKTEHVPVTAEEAYKLLSDNPILDEWVRGQHLMFVDGYFVTPSEKYIKYDNSGVLHLTKAAKKNLAACTLNITEQRYVSYKNASKDLVGYAFMYKQNGVDKKLLTFHPKYQTDFNAEPEEVYKAFNDYLDNYDETAEKDLVRMLGDPSTTLCQCLWPLIDKKGWQYPLSFYENTLVHENYHGKIKNNKANNMTTEVLLPICIALGLRLRLIEKIFEKSNNKLDYYNDPDKTYIHILETMPEISLDEFNGILDQRGLEKLGTKEKS